MSIKSALVKQAARIVTKIIQKQSNKALDYQQAIMNKLVKVGQPPI
jgi:hypothetical protein